MKSHDSSCQLHNVYHEAVTQLYGPKGKKLETTAATTDTDGPQTFRLKLDDDAEPS